MKKGLVLEGGAMRGLFTAGVIDVFMENNIEFDGAIGVSAGAAFGCNFKSKQIGRVLRYNKRFSKDKRYCSLSSLIKTGDMYGAEFCYHTLPEKLDLFDYETYNKNPMEFYAVCTDIDTGNPVYHNCPVADYNFMEWLRASASMPIASRIVEVDGYKLLDGGISDSVPIRYFENIGYDRNIVVLTQPYDYVKSKNKLMPIIKLKYKKYPGLVEKMRIRHEIYNESINYIKEREKSGEIIVLRPEHSLGIGRTEKNPDKLTEVYNSGRKIAEKNLDKIKKFL